MDGKLIKWIIVVIAISGMIWNAIFIFRAFIIIYLNGYYAMSESDPLILWIEIIVSFILIPCSFYLSYEVIFK